MSFPEDSRACSCDAVAVSGSNPRDFRYIVDIARKLRSRMPAIVSFILCYRYRSNLKKLKVSKEGEVYEVYRRVDE